MARLKPLQPITGPSFNPYELAPAPGGLGEELRRVTPVLPPQRRKAIQLGQMLAQPFSAPKDDTDKRQRSMAMAQALQSGITRPTVSGSILEGLTRAGEAYFTTRAAREGINREDAKEAEAKARDAARRKALADAVMAGKDLADPNARMNAQIDVLGQNPDTAEMALGQRMGMLQGEAERTARKGDAREMFEMERTAKLEDAPKLAETQLFTQGYRPDGKGGYARFGPAADDYELKRRQIMADMIRANAAADKSPVDKVMQKRDGARLEAADAARANANLFINAARQFKALNADQDTGGWDANFAGMNDKLQQMQAITNQLAPMMREAGSGSMSDKDVEMFLSSLPSIRNKTEVNSAIADKMEVFARNSQQYGDFLERYYTTQGTTAGAQEVWDQYSNAQRIVNPDTGKVRADRPSFDQWLSSGRPAFMTQSEINAEVARLQQEAASIRGATPAGGGEQISPDQFRQAGRFRY